MHAKFVHVSGFWMAVELAARRDPVAELDDEVLHEVLGKHLYLPAFRFDAFNINTSRRTVNQR